MNFLRLALRGEGGYRQYRIPALSVTKSGRLIAIYDGRADFDDLPAPIDLLIRTSDDNGSSWSEQSIFRAHEGVSGYGDASIIVDPSYGDLGRIIVLYQFTQHAGFFESTLGTNLDDPNIAQIARSISDDDGKTWRHDFITDQLKDSQTPGIFATSGMGTQISSGEFSGRLLQTFVLRRENQLLSAIGFSDDHGDTWKLGAIIPNGNETE
jgi:sialidase-1